MSLTLGLTGMDPATEAALKAAFADANARLGDRWRLVSEAEADHVVVDMDSMYGPMSWLRLHAAGKHVIGLTSSPRTQTDFRLGRPFDSQQVGQLLADIAGSLGGGTTEAPAPAPGPETAAPEEPFATEASALAAAVPSGATPAPEPRDQLPEETPAAVDVEQAPPVEADVAMPASAEDAAVPPAPPAPPPVAAPPPPRERGFGDWLAPGGLTRRVRYRRPSGPTLLIDPVAQVWHGPTPLKPITAYFDGAVDAGDFEPVDDASWATDAQAAGPAQPLSRLHWLGGLLAGSGELLPGYDPEGRYALTKWPQTEREFPRHFRIATAMMKGPATLAEIASASGVPVADVTDFVNANLATGFAEFVPEAPPAPAEPAKPSGLFGRLRNR